MVLGAEGPHPGNRPTLKTLLVTASEELREELRGLSTSKLVCQVARLRASESLTGVTAATKFALLSVARRYRHLCE
jgi:hypothetical protein